MEKVLNKLLFIHYIETLNKKVFYIIDINMLGCIKTSTINICPLKARSGWRNESR